MYFSVAKMYYADNALSVFHSTTEDITFENTPQTQYPWSGTDALIQCEASGDPVPTVWWRKQGEVIESGLSIIVFDLESKIFVASNLCPTAWFQDNYEIV